MAIGVMTARATVDDGSNREEVADVADLMMDSEGTSVTDLADGLISLAGWLLWTIKKLTGNTAEKTLQDIAQKLARGG